MSLYPLYPISSYVSHIPSLCPIMSPDVHIDPNVSPYAPMSPMPPCAYTGPLKPTFVPHFNYLEYSPEPIESGTQINLICIKVFFCLNHLLEIIMYLKDTSII